MPAGLRRAVGRVGDRSGEVWLHLLGFALEGPAPREAAGLMEAVDAADPLTVRQHLVGAFVPAWRGYLDQAVLLAAAAGPRSDRRAAADGAARRGRGVVRSARARDRRGAGARRRGQAGAPPADHARAAHRPRRRRLRLRAGAGV